MVRLFACITILSAVLVSLFSLTSLRERETFVLVGRVEGKAPEGRVPLAFHFYDVKTRDLVYRVVADVEVRNGTYSAVLPVGSLRKGGEFYVCATAPEVVLESFQEQGGGVLGIVLLQSSTPGIQQTGHINISGTLISGSVKTSSFQMSTGAGAGRVLTSDASGVGTWQALPPPSGSAGGDLSGTYPNPTVARLQTRPVSSTAPSSGQVLKWTGTMWAPADDGLTLPFSGSANVDSGAMFSITNTATSGLNFGVWVLNASRSGYGVFGWASATSGINYGVWGESASTSGRGVVGYASATSGINYGVWGESASMSGYGVLGVATATSGTNYGGYFQSNGASGRGVFGVATATSGTTYGGYFEIRSTSGVGVFGYASAFSGANYGVYGQSLSDSGTGVYGVANAAVGTTYGGYFQSNSTSGTGVVGRATATSGLNYGVYGRSDSTSGTGVYGVASATSGFTYGGYFQSNSTSGTGVVGWANATSGPAWGVVGTTNSSASNAYGVRGDEPSGGAGHAVYANGSFAATGTKAFQIDHPLNPENYYLNHFCTEGPDPMNAYSGNVVTDEKGYATIQLPDYFESINRDFRYQLTVVDDGERDDFVLVKVVRKIRNNQFTIRTSAPHVEVSWEVKAIRNDRYVQKYGYQTVQEKEDSIKGKYVQPELYGMPKEYGIHYRPDVERPALERATPPAHLEPPRTPRLEERKAPATPPSPSARQRASERERSLPERKPSQSPRSNRSR